MGPGLNASSYPQGSETPSLASTVSRVLLYLIPTGMKQSTTNYMKFILSWVCGLEFSDSLGVMKVLKQE